MAGPYTAFTYGTPKISPATITKVAVKMQGPVNTTPPPPSTSQPAYGLVS